MRCINEEPGGGESSVGDYEKPSLQNEAYLSVLTLHSGCGGEKIAFLEV